MRTLEAMGAPHLEAEARLLSARAHHDAGDAGAAERELERARRLLAGLGATARLHEVVSD